MATEVKRFVLIALVVIIVLTGVPLLMAMPGMADCADCGIGMLVTSTCLAVLVALTSLQIALAAARWKAAVLEIQGLLAACRLDRPPRLV